MSQVRFYTITDEATARSLATRFEFAFEESGYPVSAFEILETPGVWELSVYVPVEDARTVLDLVQQITRDEGLEIEFETEMLEDQDWVAKTLRELAPVRAGRYIVHGSHDSHIPGPHEIAVQVDAGLAFGTGHHGTTAGCLAMLDREAKRNTFQNVLDLGTGSGVLAIAAAKTFTCHVLATDIDPISTETAKDNAKLNGTQAHVECLTSVGFTQSRIHNQAPFDLVLANILAKPLQAMAFDLATHTAHGGTIILSGLLPHQRAPLVSSLRHHGVVLDHAHIRDGWLTLVMKKP